MAEIARPNSIALAVSGARRMVIGHTSQEGGINAACEGRVWRIDVGIAKYDPDPRVQVLEIVGDQVRILD